MATTSRPRLRAEQALREGELESRIANLQKELEQTGSEWRAKVATLQKVISAADGSLVAGEAKTAACAAKSVVLLVDSPGEALRAMQGTQIIVRSSDGLQEMDHVYSETLRMGMLFQSGALLTDLSVFENVAFPIREHTRLPEAPIRHVVLMKLNTVGLRGARGWFFGDLGRRRPLRPGARDKAGRLHARSGCRFRLSIPGTRSA